MVESVRKDFGPISVLVNNAGINRDRTFSKMTGEEWDEVMAVNLRGTFNVTKVVLPDMVQANWGRVINISSFVGQRGNFGQANYAASKAGIIGMTKSAGSRNGQEGDHRKRLGAGIYRNGHDRWNSRRSAEKAGGRQYRSSEWERLRRSRRQSSSWRVRRHPISRARRWASTAASYLTAAANPRPGPASEAASFHPAASNPGNRGCEGCGRRFRPPPYAWLPARRRPSGAHLAFQAAIVIRLRRQGPSKLSLATREYFQIGFGPLAVSSDAASCCRLEGSA